MPANLGGGLRELAAEAATPDPQRRAAAVQEHVRSKAQRAQTDAAGRVVVDVHLNGAAPVAEVRAKLLALGANVIAAEPAGRSTAAVHGVISAFLPVEQAVAASKLPGVQSVMLIHRPWRRVGAKTSQGLAPLKVRPVQSRGFKGNGITLGVISDSYNLTKPGVRTDIRNGDLPGGENPANPTPVNVLEEGREFDPFNADEGRALLQIIHDVAPESALAFCSTGNTQATFAEAVRRLRTEGDCDIILDDIGYADEPFFSDGVAARAVEEVVNSTTLPGRKALFYSAAGNTGGLGYEADFAPVSNADARAGNIATAGTNNLKLDKVPPAFTAGGFHDFAPGSKVDIAQEFIVGQDYAQIDFQWNDLFDAARMTSDFNVLVFDTDGTFLGDIGGGQDNNFSTGQAFEILGLYPNRDGSEHTYQLAITKTQEGSGNARHFRYIVNTNGSLDGEYFDFGVPSIFGHAGARSSNAVGAYDFSRLARPEAFSSFGPVSIYFDDQGNRLTTPEIRQQPSISGPDGVATTVTGFSRFFGTSAAVPHAAGVVALLLEANGGPGSLTTAQARTALQTTAFPHDLDPLAATAVSITDRGTVTLTGRGDETNFAAMSDRFFTLSFTGDTGSQLKRVVIDLTAAGLEFDPTMTLGMPFTVGGMSGGATEPMVQLASKRRKLILTFTAFPSGGTLQFGIDRDFARTSAGANSGDRLAQGTVTAAILTVGATEAVPQRADFMNEIGSGYSPADGFGFINANSAARSLGQ